jgi:hypothetical protein
MSVRERLLGSKTGTNLTEEDREKLLKHQLEYELDRLGQTTTVLDSSSATISSIFSANQDFRSRLSKASEALGLFRRKIERDQRFVLLAFWAMVVVAVFVISRRIGLVWLFKASVDASYRFLGFVAQLPIPGEQEL